MNVINREFKEIGSGDVYKITEVYKNLAIGVMRGSNLREKISVDELMNPKLYTPVDGQVVHQQAIHAIPINNERKSPVVNIEETVDPNKFFSSDNTFRVLEELEEQIKSLSLDKIPKDDSPVSTSSISRNMMPLDNDSAIIIDDGYDEAEEISRKYGINSNVGETIRAQNEKFHDLIDPEEFPEVVTHHIPSPEQPQQSSYVPPVQHIRVDDPITSMFRNVKRTIDFTLDLKIQNKIPRIDFIEMMEDSYQVSIIEFLSEEFAQELLNNPNGLKKMISDKIRSIVYKEKAPVKAVKKSTPRKTSKVEKKSTT